MNNDLKDYFKNMFASVDKNIVLDDDQINAILCDDKYTLVLAVEQQGMYLSLYKIMRIYLLLKQ